VKRWNLKILPMSRVFASGSLLKVSFLSALILLGMNSATHGEIASDLNFIMNHNPVDPVKGKDSSPFTFNQTNEVKLSLMGLIRAYQLFISTQDMAVCNFTPSCSRFGMRALKEYGVFHGILMTSDRLQRCNGIGRKYYSINPVTGKCHDPVEPNFLGSK
jgi:putative membrane protein insertion efficiency factor